MTINMESASDCVSCLNLRSAENEPTFWIVSVLASLLQRLVARNERLLLSSGKQISKENLCAFSATQVPAMSIQKYLERIFKYAHCSPSAFVVAYAYLDHLILYNRGFQLTSLNIHRLVITSVMAATKFLDDLHYGNEYFAKVGGLSLPELNHQELEFLFMIRFRLEVSVSVFASHYSHFKREVALGGRVQIERTIFCLYRKEPCREAEHSTKQRLGVGSSYSGC